MVYRTADSGRVDQSAQRKFKRHGERRAGGREVRRLGNSRPYIFFLCLAFNLLGGGGRGGDISVGGSENETLTVIVSPVWVLQPSFPAARLVRFR